MPWKPIERGGSGEVRKRIEAMAPGQALFLRQKTDDGRWEAAWILRLDPDAATIIASNPPVEMRVRLFEEKGIVLVPFYVRIGSGETASIFGTWLDNCESGVIEDFVNQDRILIYLHDGGRTRRIAVTNEMKLFFQQALARVAAAREWSPDEFRAAYDRILVRHPTATALWNALGDSS